ncbi:MAG: flap endonuclease [Verrucomicrobia bacterium]|nr:flap endonuclease [Verrucomicrobiota bacterium]
MMRLLLVDGHYYLYRSYFAIRGLKNSRGEPTNAIYGFVKALRKMLLDLKPDLAAVIWDAGLPERRTTLQPAYKQHREEMPNDLDEQQEPLREVIPYLGVKNILLPNTEADDLIASYVVEARKQGMECIIATNDKDILQLVNDHVFVYSVAKADLEGKNESYALLGIPEVRQKWEVEPHQIADLLALTGDASDNIPGISGVGKKTAAKWIQRYGSLESLLTATDLDPKIDVKLKSSREQVMQNRLMVALDLDLPLPVPVQELDINPCYPELVKALRNFEFQSLTAAIEKEAASWGVVVDA